MSTAYTDEFERVARLAFSMWNRDPASPSFGSFDRQYWGWKYKDFSDATLQYAVRLAVEYARARGAVAGLPALLPAFVSYCARIQRRDGSFDQCYPYERTPGVVFDILSTLIYVRQSEYLGSDEAKSELDRTIESAAGFTLRTDETHGAVANHYAEYAYELIHYSRYARSDAAAAKAQQYLDRLLALFDRKEGWFEEYGGPDPGYQTRTLRYLAKIAEFDERTDLWPVIYRAAEFVEDLMMPDGSLHPMLGSRSTALFYPSAFEILARRDGRFHALAARVREAWRSRQVPLPSEIDFCNAIRLADDAREAATACEGARGSSGEGNAPSVQVDFEKAGIAVRRGARHALYVNWRMGGAVVVYVKTHGTWKLAHEDSGYLLKSQREADVWLTRMPNAGELVHSSADRVQLRASFYRSLHDEVTPLRLIVLRILNMTLLRFQVLADGFRKLVVRRLMGNRLTAPIRLERRINVGEGTITITDGFSFEAQAGSSLLNGALYRCRRMTGTHMASSRYFQPQELEDAGHGWLERIPWGAGAASPPAVRIDYGHE